MSFKKVFTGVSVAMTLGYAGAASAFLENWFLDPDGAGGAANRLLVNEYLDIVGPSYVATTAPVAGNFSFNEITAVRVTGSDGDGGIGIGATGFTGNVTALATISGTGTLGGALTYTGGTINVYSATPGAFGTTAGTYGANVGTLIATFSPVTGSGLIDPTGIPNGVQTIQARATFMAAGYWFDANNTDLSTVVNPNPANSPIFGFATTNASRVANASATVISELAPAGYTNPGCLPGQIIPGCTGPGSFIISNNGQFRLVPEPGSLALLGLSLATAGFFYRRRRS